MTYKDILVEEVRERREKLLKQYDFDIDKIFKVLKQRESHHKDKIVSQILVQKSEKEPIKHR